MRARFTPASRSAANNSAIFTSKALPYEVCHRLARVGNWRNDWPIPVPTSASTEQNATAENRGTT